MTRIFELLLVFALLRSAFACFGDVLPDDEKNGDGDGNGDDYSNYLDYSDESSYGSKESTTVAPESTTEKPVETTEEPSVEETTPDDSSKEEQIDDLKDQVDDNQKYVELIPCIFLSCNFEKGSMCMYRNLGPPAGPRKDGPSGPLAGSHKGQPSPQDFSETEDIIDDIESELADADLPAVGLKVDDADDLTDDTDDTDDGTDDMLPTEEGGPDYAFDPDEEDIEDAFDRKRARKLKLRRRKKRLPKFAYSWQTVTGRFGNRITGVRKAAEGSYYSAAYIRPNQQAAFEARVIRLSEDVQISFQAYEGVAGMRMQVCCETKEPKQIVKCGYETEEFVGPMGYHEWQLVETSCPAGTERIIFICKNLDKHQGACAVDDIKVRGEQCPQLTAKANSVLPRRRKHRKRRRH